MTTVNATLTPGADRTLEADFSSASSSFGATVSSIDWGIVSGVGFVTLGVPANYYSLSKSIILLTHTASNPGLAVIRAEALFSDGQSASIWFNLTYESEAAEHTDSGVEFNIQDDSGAVANANAYVSLSYFSDYCSQRGYAIPYSVAEQQIAIISATDYLDIRFNYKGKKLLGRDQTTQWPRSNIWDNDRYYVTGIPEEVKEACSEYAFRALTTALVGDPDRDGTGAVVQSKTETVDVISNSVTYASGAVFQMPKYPAADQKLIKAGLVHKSGRLARG